MTSSKVPGLRKDYEPEGSFGTWEAVLFHPPAEVTTYMRAYETILDWARQSPEGVENAYVEAEEGESGPMDPKRAFQLLLDQTNDVWQVTVYLFHPLILRFGDTNTEAKAWFEKDQLELIMNQKCAVSGDFRVDMANFFNYRKVIVGLAKVLHASGFVWGDSVDGTSAANAMGIHLLSDEEALWGCFDAVLYENLGGSPPRWVRREFFESCKTL